MTHRALANSQLIVDRNENLAQLPLSFGPRAGLLYPGKQSRLISEVPAAQRPQQLVILDGTWNHAKTLFRDIPALHHLPQYKIIPDQPGQYRIRREPTPFSLSTVEAIVAVLKQLEPQTENLDQLLAAFDAMVTRQIDHPKYGSGWRHFKQRARTPVNIPSAIIKNLDDIVVAYGESAGGERDAIQSSTNAKTKSRLPIFWVAQRLGTGEKFSAAIHQPGVVLTQKIFDHLQLNESYFQSPLSVNEFRNAWQSFLRPGDQLAVHHQSTADLLKNIDAVLSPCLVLKSIHFRPDRKYSTLDQFFAGEEIPRESPDLPGRAGQRLANAITFVKHLHDLAASFPSPSVFVPGQANKLPPAEFC
jgi:hypothetical protein